ncbi:MAG: DNA translocase FtsK [Bacteroidetes bacterium]|nr:DNA translocase FtsK [Bacteroidota bacterium]
MSANTKRKIPAEAEVPEPAPAPKRRRRSARKEEDDAAMADSSRAFWRDPRFRKTSGLVLLLMAVFLLVSFSSYFFEYTTDHDKVHGRGFGMIFDQQTDVNNALGRLGAWVGNQLVYLRFGISAYLLVLLTGATGVNLLYGKNTFALRKLYGYCLLAMLWISTALAFAFGGFSDLPGGGLGRFLAEWLQGAVGGIGTALTLSFVLLVFSVVFLNAELKLPLSLLFGWLRKKPQGAVAGATTAEQEAWELRRQSPTYYSPDEADAEFSAANRNRKRNGAGADEMEEEDLAEEMEEDSAGGLTLEVSNPRDVSGEEVEEEETEEEGEESEEEEESEDDGEEETDDADQPKLDITEPVLEKTLAEYGSLGSHYDPTMELPGYQYPTLELLQDYGSSDVRINTQELERNKDQIIETLNNYGITISKIKATIGPTVTLYEIVPAKGVRISKIKNLEDDIALNLAALGIRIIAPIPGKGTIGIEVPNVDKTIVGMKTQLGSEKFLTSKMELPVCLGKTISGENYVADLARMPHLLMAGATGQGKSVGINALLVSLLYKKHPSELKLILVDPKKVELSLFERIENHFLAKLPGEEEAIVTDTRKVVNTLNALCIEMDNRYDLLKKAQTRNITEYNQKFLVRRLNPNNGHRFLPFIVLVIDEFADLIMTAGKEVEMPLARLAQLARAVGIHLVIATQRPSVNIITGLIKANFPARIAFKVTAKVDSRTILDTGGADQLVGRGDMLLSIGSDIIRLQCPFVDTPEVEEVVDFIARQPGPAEPFYLPEYIDEKEAMAGEEFEGERDSMFPEAARLVVHHQQGSTSLIQRKMRLGYNRAGRLMDQLESAGIVGPNLGSKAREVLIRDTAELERLLETTV